MITKMFRLLLGYLEVILHIYCLGVHANLYKAQLGLGQRLLHPQYYKSRGQKSQVGFYTKYFILFITIYKYSFQVDNLHHSPLALWNCQYNVYQP